VVHLEAREAVAPKKEEDQARQQLIATLTSAIPLVQVTRGTPLRTKELETMRT